MKIELSFQDGIYSAALFTVHKGEMVLFTYSKPVQLSDASRDYENAAFEVMAKHAFMEKLPELAMELNDLPEYKRYDSVSERNYHDNYS